MALQEINSASFVDVPASVPAVRFPLDWVGITNRPHYFRVLDPFDGRERDLLTKVSVAFNLSANQRGLHMSRIEAGLLQAPPASFTDLAKNLASKLFVDQKQANCRVSLVAKYEKSVSKNTSGKPSTELIELFSTTERAGEKTSSAIGVTVPFINSCPCSQRWAIREFANALSANGRSAEEIVDLVQLAPRQSHTNAGKASLVVHSDRVSHAKLYEILERAVPIIRELLAGRDEHDVVRDAHKRASFCEDNARDIVAAVVGGLKGLLGPAARVDVLVEVDESIHHHNLFASVSGSFENLSKKLEEAMA